MGIPVGMPGLPLGAYSSAMGSMGAIPWGTLPGLPLGLPQQPGGLAPQGTLAARRSGGSQGRGRRWRSASSSRGGSEGRSCSEGGGSRRREQPRRSPERIQEVEQFLRDNDIDEDASSKVRALSPASQRHVTGRPLVGAKNPSKVMIARVREQMQAIDRFVREHRLDDRARHALRGMPPQHQAIAMRWDLRGYDNPSSKFMSLINDLPPARSFFPMPGMLGPYGMHPGMTAMGMPTMGMPMPGMRPFVPFGMVPPGMDVKSSGKHSR